MIYTVFMEYTENAEDNIMINITKTVKFFYSHVAYTYATGLNMIDIQICLHHVCSIHEHSHGGLHTTSVYFHLISSHSRPTSIQLPVHRSSNNQAPSTNGTSLFESNTLMLWASVKSTHFLKIRVQIVIT